MALEIKYSFKVTESGEIKITNRKSFVAEMQKYFPNMSVIGTFRKPRKLRSTAQNAYYHSCVIPEVIDALTETGFDSNEFNREVVHDMLRHKFLTKDLPSPDFSGEFITITRSTTDLSVGEFMDYIAEIQRWCATYLNHVIPDPNQQKEINY